MMDSFDCGSAEASRPKFYTPVYGNPHSFDKLWSSAALLQLMGVKGGLHSEPIKSGYTRNTLQAGSHGGFNALTLAKKFEQSLLAHAKSCGKGFLRLGPNKPSQVATRMFWFRFI